MLHALAKDRDARYQSAANMRADCEALMAGRPISPEAAGALGVPAGPVPGLAAEAAMAASAMATEAYGVPPEATQAMPMATEAIPAGLGGAAMTSDAMGIGLPPGDDGVLPPPKPNRAPAFVLLGLAAIAAIVLLLVFGPKIFGGSGDNVAKVTVPPVTQLSQADATTKLTRLGLKVVGHQRAGRHRRQGDGQRAGPGRRCLRRQGRDGQHHRLDRPQLGAGAGRLRQEPGRRDQGARRRSASR